MTEQQHGKFGKDKHFELMKKALIHVVENYWETFGVIKVENTKITLQSYISSESIRFGSTRGEYDIHPDIVVTIKQQDDEKTEKMIVVECETSTNNLLKDEMRLTAYKLLRLRQGKDKLMMYIALPSELKGKVEKPECFNDLLFFDLEAFA